MAYTFLTGATGLLGRYLIRDLTMAGVPLAVLVRPSRRATAQHRVESVMCHWDAQAGRPLPRPVVLEGDITEPDLALDARTMRWVAENCDVMLHNAASLTFQSTSPSSEPWRSNVEGTRHVLELCRNARISQFHHVSTAYVCGLRQGRILESEVDVGQKTSNDYEESKLRAEKMIRSSTFLDRLTVYRPAIIIGDTKTAYTTTYHGFYAPLQAVYTMARTMEPNETGRVGASARFALSGYETKNLVPVDWVSAVISHLVTHPEHHGKTYHLTPRHPVTARLLGDALEEAAGFYGVRLEGSGRQLTGLTEYEQLFCELISVYSSYWKDDPTFDASNTRSAAPHLPCPHIDRQMLRWMAEFAIRVNFTSPRAKPIEPPFDIARALESYVDGTPPVGLNGDSIQKLGLRVTGHGGGDWTLSIADDEPIAADPGVQLQMTNLLTCDAELLADVAAGRLSSEEALRSVRTTIQGDLPPAALVKSLNAICQNAAERTLSAR